MIGQVRKQGTSSKGAVRWALSPPNGILSRLRFKVNGREHRICSALHAHAPALSIPPYVGKIKSTLEDDGFSPIRIL